MLHTLPGRVRACSLKLPLKLRVAAAQLEMTADVTIDAIQEPVGADAGVGRSGAANEAVGRRPDGDGEQEAQQLTTASERSQVPPPPPPPPPPLGVVGMVGNVCFAFVASLFPGYDAF